ncbi:MAG: phosphoenolpyruvate--protein phosphotransferase [Peptoniphilaceae bacterium]|uniref:phosphoenolpyruvate--protein phosphotransferase n=1 Tax=Parvimonas sp. TaxID=1944660 RepID=UPI0025CC5CED|nr:phosphoenolpyruvate--protein phosphotransferase [Parvimonas sp.]MCI5998009.1 phosphoenolpyruvate--protein phosphotransferase [Parvimonas sp.]MDD7764405.1 phosphoenolpyruvate--protein phosphotransferase [Peptoniphilaceae bacterium]MDY3051385.1 phosphoenolpyruvate--protein phosphotransferase [Parvimonas sp.]
MREYLGFSVSKGVVLGKTVTLVYENNLVKEYITDDEKNEEYNRFKNLLKLYDEVEFSLHDENSKKLLNIHHELIDDPYLQNGILNRIKDENMSLEKAIDETFNEICFELNSLESEYMRDRIYDYISIREEFLNSLSNQKEDIDEESFILIVENLSPKIVEKYKNKLLGIISVNGGKTSHASLYAKNLSIPYIICNDINIENFKDREFDCILDCVNGKVILEPDVYAVKTYSKLFTIPNVETMYLDIARTKNNKYIKVCSNISGVDEFQVSLNCGTDGCGLFRTEFLYMQDNFPTEDYQFQIFKSLAQSTDKEIIIRTFDIGADKKSKFFMLEDEKNPFLGLRGFRIYKSFHKELRRHLRAILRASAYGNIKIMIPMITNLEEVLWIKNEINKIKDELREEKMYFDENIAFGIMIETPSSVVLFDILVKEVDFISIGTNDLVQYMLACDRENSKIQQLYDCYNPSVIRSIYNIVKIAHKNGKKVGMCGNFASDLDAVELLILLGIDEFSVTNDVLQTIKKRIRNFDKKYYLDFFEKLYKFKTGREILNYFDSK